MRYKFYLFVVLVWAALLSAAIAFLSVQKIKEFDPQQKLSAAMPNPEFDSQFKAELINAGFDTQNRVFHFESEKCFCQHIASPHIQSVQALADTKVMTNVVVNLDEHKALIAMLPSVPATAVFDDSDKLIYLGPYSTGMYCSPNQGIVERYIDKTALKQSFATVINEAKGCYCNL